LFAAATVIGFLYLWVRCSTITFGAMEICSGRTLPFNKETL